LRLLNEHVPTDWKIHMHCFGESPEMAAQLLATYPNVYFGFTGTRSLLDPFTSHVA
jgi:TatD DNase family protein